MITIQDVAKRAGVSVTTVSNVLNSNGKFSQATKEKVDLAIKELNYIPSQMARGLKSNTSRSIGIICEDLNFTFSNRMIDGICSYADNQGYHISLTNLGMNHLLEDAEEYTYTRTQSTPEFKDKLDKSISQLLAARVNGIIYVSIHPRDITALIPSMNIPIVYLYAYTSSDNDNCINYDDFSGAQLAVNHLIKHGHKKIGIISGTIDSIPVHRRMMGFQTALMEHNLTFLPEYVTTGNWHFRDGYQLCQTLLSLPDPPTAIFSMSDIMAYGAISYCLEHNIKIPEELSIIGYDNLKSSEYVYPSLTSIDVPLYQMGAYSAEAAIQLIEQPGKASNYTKLFQCSLCERKSVKKNSK